MSRRLLPFVVAAATLLQIAQAQGPLTTAFTYQGELRTSGNPATGLYDLRFRLYDAPTGGTQLGSQLCADNVSLANGRFTIQLDFGAQFAGQQRFLEIDVRQDTGLDCTNATGFILLSPRQPLTAAPYAGYALNTASAATATNATQLNGQGASFYQNAANLSSGTIPSARLAGIYSSAITLSSASNSLSGSGAGLTSLNASSLSSGTVSDSLLSANIPRLNTTNAFGNFTTSFLGNVGIGTASPGMRLTVAGDMELGVNSADYRKFRIGGGNSNGFIYGSYRGLGDGIHMGYNYYYDPAGAGQIVHPDGGTSRISTGYGTVALATGPIGQAPANRLTIDTTGAVRLANYASFWDGVNFNTNFYNSAAIAGYATGQNGYGFYGTCESTGGVGAYGHGVFAGVYGASNNNYGVYGWAAGYSVYALGSMGASGSKSFRIDHPADPQNRYLLHYCSESPDVTNFYSGKVILDQSGHATVELPAYFAAINKDPRYTLTAVGAAMPMLHVDQEIDEAALAAGNAVEPGQPIPAVWFRIAGGAPGGKVSWRIDAIRNDRWVQAHGAPVEMDKPEGERGLYQHPDLYNQPAGKGMGSLVGRHDPAPAH